ncbi:hypothetical protein MMC22_011683 [Lobaria immixta]|nr:hypothetical protein [Lobaria immixta]
MVGESDAHSQPAREGEPSSSQDPGLIDYPNLPPLSPVSQFEYDDSQSLGVANDNSQRESDEEHTEIGERQIPDSGSDRSTSDQFEESFESPGSYFGEPPESPGPIPDPYPHPPPFPHYTMSDSSITSALNKASEIKKLNGPDDWVEWNRKLRGHLGMVGLWKILTGETPALVTETAEHTVWQLNQDRLASLLLLVTGPSALSLVELNIDNTATEQYQVLKNAYNTTTITTYSRLYRQIFQCNITNHKSLKEYGEEIANARNKLKELKRPLDELAVTCAFLNGLNASYQAWKDMFLGGYAKNPTTVQNGQEVMVVPTLEEILKLLIDREAGTSQTAARPSSIKGQREETSLDTDTKISEDLSGH